MKNKKLFKKLSQEYTNEELAEAFVFPHGLSTSEKAEADEELQKYRFQRLREATEEQRLLADLVQLRIKIEDYIKKEPYQKEKSFGHFLQQYLKIIDKKRKEFAKDLGVHYTKLSRLLNDKEAPNLDILFRIEIHAGQLISALLWWKLLIKKMEIDIKENKVGRAGAAQKVENKLVLSR
jgi:plasmid maintenance system antidote protein VapI